MKITLFKNMKGLIHGVNPKRIFCTRAGVLKIGKIEINIKTEEDAIMPMLFNGCTGNYDATFTDKDGITYQLEKLAIRGGFIQSPPPTTVELMELRCRTDAAEENIEEIFKKIDTNSLNFLIKGED